MYTEIFVKAKVKNRQDDNAYFFLHTPEYTWKRDTPGVGSRKQPRVTIETWGG